MDIYFMSRLIIQHNITHFIVQVGPGSSLNASVVPFTNVSPDFLPTSRLLPYRGSCHVSVQLGSAVLQGIPIAFCWRTELQTRILAEGVLVAPEVMHFVSFVSFGVLFQVSFLLIRKKK